MMKVLSNLNHPYYDRQNKLIALRQIVRTQVQAPPGDAELASSECAPLPPLAPGKMNSKLEKSPSEIPPEKTYCIRN